ncbi:MAG: hypothetical protein IPH49_10655 [Ignavibacteria bacterium]|nr:hypothetical protein [Ignavibacteria bacterium]
MFVRKETVKQLSREMSLPYKGNEQDWDIELADKNRVDEFISFYNDNDLSNDMKYAAMSTILALHDYLLDDTEIDRDYRWYEIERMLKSEKQLFSDLIEYWAVETEIEDVFRITPLVREVRATW